VPSKRKRKGPVVLTQARDIKALTHPARLAVLDEFLSGRELTATECAEIAGVTPSAMSYHLRALEHVGIIERAGSSGDGRQRPWRAAGSELQISPESVAGATAVSAILANNVLVRMNTELTEWIARSSREPEDWRDSSGVMWLRIWLTLDEVRELDGMIRQYIDARRERSAADRPGDARRVRIGVLAFPLDEPPANQGGGAT
jgi:DNA-binding transcriptional ArsR family regulator